MKKIFDKYLLLVEVVISKILSFNKIEISKEDLENYYNSKNNKYSRLKAFLIPTRVFSEIVKDKNKNNFSEYMEFLVKRSGVFIILCHPRVVVKSYHKSSALSSLPSKWIAS